MDPLLPVQTARSLFFLAFLDFCCSEVQVSTNIPQATDNVHNFAGKYIASKENFTFKGIRKGEKHDILKCSVTQ